ncbi:MAG: xanthine dehydrogenase family protein molybdopterin-binding subunit [Candidatus Marinimicrobia bacterium]|nr:xanthine dehydrogenase family protein molybdopterin-binding subunit [Candidatus Neomarinimicrobiota bacterium]
MSTSTHHLSRREFIKLGSGSTVALILGINWTLAKGKDVEKAPTLFSPNAYLSISNNDSITVVMPRSEMGQKIYTALPMILAEELEADWNKIKVVQGDLNQIFGSQTTGGSASIRTQYDRLRRAGATAKTMLVQAAAQEWSINPNDCWAAEGFVYNKVNKQKLSYGSLVGIAASLPVPKDVVLKNPQEFRIIGKAYKSLDGLAKIDGSLKYGYDFKVPNMLTAVVARIPRYGNTLKDFDSSDALKIPGVKKVASISSGVAVIAEDTYSAIQGRKKLKLNWNSGPFDELDSKTISLRLHEALKQKGTILKQDGNVDAAKIASSQTWDLTFEVPYLDHAPQEPNNCTAYIHEGVCEVWAPTQSPGNAFWGAKLITGFKDEQIKIHTLRIGGGFGRRLQKDYVEDAVEVALHMDQPVKVVRMRSEDIKNGFYRPASVHQVSVGVDSDGIPTYWEHHISGPSNDSSSIFTGGAENLAYAIPNQKISYVMTDLPVPIGAWRSVGNTQTAYVNECVIDVIARRTKQDPVVLRKNLLKDHPRHLGVLNLAAKKANWGSELPENHARGVAVHYSFQSYVAIVAEVSKTLKGKIKVEKITAVIDCGTVINPDGVHAQVEGGVVMALTAALHGEITILDGQVKQSNFHNYPLLTMAEMPEISTHIVKSTEAPTGAGEPPVPPTTPALMNAIAALTGNRITKLPLKDQLN